MPLPEERKYTADEFFSMFPESNSERYELYEGKVVAMASPSIQHQRICGGVYSAIKNFIAQNGGTCETFISPVDVKLDDKTVVIPDVFIVCDTSKLDEKRCNGAPDFVIEVTSSNKEDDFIRKLALYQNAGVREYWIISPQDQKTLVYFFEKSVFPNIYTFDTPVPIEIYNRKLTITISDLI